MRSAIIDLSYSMILRIDSFEERLEALQTYQKVGEETFGPKRYINQQFYQSSEWKKIKRDVIIRDGGFDLAHKDHPISRPIIVHHIIPITEDDIINRRPEVFSLENLISCSVKTHKMIHYGSKLDVSRSIYMERSKNDTCPWRR